MISFDPRTFFASIRENLFGGTLSQRQVDGINAILKAWVDGKFSDDRWLAYCLATTYHETGKAMWPVREGGRGHGHPYGEPGKHAGQAPYGRGFVQITWDANYERADKELGLNGKLLTDFDLALDPKIAAQILLVGMAEGWFTKFKLADYLNDRLADFLHARKIVNGMDQAEKIAGYASKFLTAITAASRVEQNPIAATLDEIGKTIGQVVNPSPQQADPQPAEANGAESAADNMELSTVLKLAEFFLANASSFVKYATVLPNVVSQVPALVQDGKDLVAAFEELVNDVKGGRIGEAPDDFKAIFVEVEQILSRFGINLGTMTDTVKQMPELPTAASVKKVAELQKAA